MISRVQLLGHDNGAGLSHDLDLLVTGLRNIGMEPYRNGRPALRHSRCSRRWIALRALCHPADFELNLMLEKFRPEFYRTAHRNVLIPNPEYFGPGERAALRRLDAVWVKTRHAERLFVPLGIPVRYIGFTSSDRRDLNVPRQQAFFHAPGRSPNKGTLALIALWSTHPEWPPLTIVWYRSRPPLAPQRLPGNIHLVRERLDDAAYRQLQNAHRFHLCPSQTEGYGHYLNEAMGCGAVVVTLDAEPMNEFVSPERGILVPAQAIGRQDLATCYAPVEGALEQAIESCLRLSVTEAAAFGQAARAWFEANQRQWNERLQTALVGGET